METKFLIFNDNNETYLSKKILKNIVCINTEDVCGTLLRISYVYITGFTVQQKVLELNYFGVEKMRDIDKEVLLEYIKKGE